MKFYFRNYLRKDSLSRKKYETLKINIAKNCLSRKEYTEKKSEFIKSILNDR